MLPLQRIRIDSNSRPWRQCGNSKVIGFALQYCLPAEWPGWVARRERVKLRSANHFRRNTIRDEKNRESQELVFPGGPIGVQVFFLLWK